MKTLIVFILFFSISIFGQIHQDSIVFYSKILNDTSFKCNCKIEREKAFNYFINQIELNKTNYKSVKKYLGYGTVVKSKNQKDITYIINCKSYGTTNGEYIYFVKSVKFTVINRRIIQILYSER